MSENDRATEKEKIKETSRYKIADLAGYVRPLEPSAGSERRIIRVLLNNWYYPKQLARFDFWRRIGVAKLE